MNNNAFDTSLSQLILLAQSARRAAKEARIEWKTNNSNEHADSKLIAALNSLTSIESTLTRYLQQVGTSSLTERDLQGEIGDCNGVIGGIYRDWGRFQDAANSYAKGRVCELRVEAMGGKPNSYCLTQELVNRVLADPKSFAEAPELAAKIKAAKSEIMKQKRSKDPWALADLAIISQLLEPQTSIDEWDSFTDLKPPRFAFDSTREVVLALKTSLSPYMNVERGDLKSWETALELLS